MLILTGFMQHVQKANKIKPVCCTCWLVEANLLNFLVMGREIIHSLQLLLFSSALGIVLLCLLPHNQCVGRGLIPRASSFDLCVNSLGKMCVWFLLGMKTDGMEVEVWVVIHYCWSRCLLSTCDNFNFSGEEKKMSGLQEPWHMLHGMNWNSWTVCTWCGRALQVTNSIRWYSSRVGWWSWS